MKPLFVDTSAFYAIMVEEDTNHGPARTHFEEVVSKRRPLVTTSYNVLETLALLQRRIGLNAVQGWNDRLRPVLEIVWIDEAFHQRALDRLLKLANRRVSLTDCAGFVCMEERSLAEAFAFDPDFATQGFRLIP